MSCRDAIWWSPRIMIRPYQSALAAKQAGLEVWCLDWREKVKAAEGVWHQRAHEAEVPIYHRFALAGVAGALRVRGVSVRTRWTRQAASRGPCWNSPATRSWCRAGGRRRCICGLRWGGLSRFRKIVSLMSLCPSAGRPASPAAKQARGQTKRTDSGRVHVGGKYVRRGCQRALGLARDPCRLPDRLPDNLPGDASPCEATTGRSCEKTLRLLDGWGPRKTLCGLSKRCF